MLAYHLETHWTPPILQHSYGGSKETSLCEGFGYCDVGLDDHWQNCTRTCANGTVIPSWLTHNDFSYLDCLNNTGSKVPPWHAPDGTPLVDMHRFPDLRGMTAFAHARGLRPGWYFG